MTTAAVRGFRGTDEVGWLRCRALSFLDTAYFDDVLPAKPTYPGNAIELVATQDDLVVGILDIAIDGPLATIETIAVHPDALRKGLASRLLDEAVQRLPSGTIEIDAWTREDGAANAWYKSQGFAEAYRYLHVFASSADEVDRAVTAAGHELRPRLAFFHGATEHEAELRASFRRVYICRRYLRTITPT